MTSGDDVVQPKGQPAPIELDPDTLWVIVGPTASGKSELALALAERFDGEIVGADSVQIYRHFDLGSGKPTVSERARVPHHLVDVRDPLDPLDAARFAAEADSAIADIRRRGRRPIVCGGTYLWIKALVRGLAPLPHGDPAIRARHAVLAESSGRAELHRQLSEIDPVAAARLSPNDWVRVSRALEVHELTGRRHSDLIEEHSFRDERHRATLLGVLRAPEELTRRIEARTADWLERGFVAEGTSLVERGYREARAMRSVGYAQVLDHVEGRLAADALHTAIVRATRVFARRQRTWLRDEPVIWLDPQTLRDGPSFHAGLGALRSGPR